MDFTASYRAHLWPTAPGRITQSWYGATPERSRGGWNFQYTYGVQGRTYTSDHISASGINLFRGYTGIDLSEGPRRYPGGSVVEVFYNPRNPQASALTTVPPDPTLLLKVLVPHLLCLALYRAVKPSRRQGPQKPRRSQPGPRL